MLFGGSYLLRVTLLSLYMGGIVDGYCVVCVFRVRVRENG